MIYVSPTGVEQEASNAVEEVRLRNWGWVPKDQAADQPERPRRSREQAEQQNQPS